MAYKYKDLGVFHKRGIFEEETFKNLSMKANHILCCMDGADFSDAYTRRERMYKMLCQFEDNAIEEVKGLFAVNDLWEWFWLMQKVEECKAEKQYSKILAQ